MKKIFIAAILLAAAGSGLYYYRQLQKIKPLSYQQKLIAGNWITDSPAAGEFKDSCMQNLNGLTSTPRNNLFGYQCQLKDEGKIYRTMKGSITTDTIVYAWEGNGTILIKENNTDSAEKRVKILLLDSIHLALQTEDSTCLYFKRMK